MGVNKAEIARLRAMTEEERRERYNAIRSSRTMRMSMRPSHADAVDRDYSDREIEFLIAMQDWKESNHDPYPAWHEVLEVIDALGYRQQEPLPPLSTLAFQDARQIIQDYMELHVAHADALGEMLKKFDEWLNIPKQANGA